MSEGEAQNAAAVPTVENARGTRRYACAPHAVLVFIVDAAERVLLLRPPEASSWQVVNGAVEGAERLLDAAMREAAEEAGADLKLRPLGVFHAMSWPYDAAIPYITSLCYLVAYEGGEVSPGDDMAGSEARWVSLRRVAAGELEIAVPAKQLWLFERARGCYASWSSAPEVSLEPPG